MAQLVGCHPANQKVTSSIPSQGTCLGCRFGPQSGHIWEAINRCFSLFPSFSFPLSLKINLLKRLITLTSTCLFVESTASSSWNFYFPLNCPKNFTSLPSPKGFISGFHIQDVVYTSVCACERVPLKSVESTTAIARPCHMVVVLETSLTLSNRRYRFTVDPDACAGHHVHQERMTSLTLILC